ncbi:hypothetical protein [Actinopolymorpha pittospori]
MSAVPLWVRCERRDADQVSAAFNTSRQIGAAIGVATFGPLLGATHNLSDGFVTCVVVGAAATAVTLLLTALGTFGRRSGTHEEPEGRRATCHLDPRHA